MVQFSITKAATPDTLTLRIHVDPYEADSPITVTAQVWAVDGSVLAAHHTALVGLEADYLDTLVRVALEAWQWGAPAQQLAPAMKRVHKEAQRHRKAHSKA